MNHFSNKKFNLIKFGKGAITVSSLALPALISTTTNAMVRNTRFVSRLYISLGGGTSSSSSSPSRNINTLRNTTTSSTGLSNSPTLKPGLTRDEYRKMVNINTGGPSSLINARIKDLYSSSTSTTSTTSNTSSLPIPKGYVANIRDRFSGTFHPTLSSDFSTQSSPTGNVALLAKNFTSSSTSTTSSSGSRKTSTPSGTGNVTRLTKNFTSSSTSTTSSSSSGKTSTPSGKVSYIRKMFGN